MQTLEAADAGLSAITDLVETAQATARQARQSAGPVTPVTAATVTGNIDLGIDAAATTTGTVDLGVDVAAAECRYWLKLLRRTTTNACRRLGFSNGEIVITLTTDGRNRRPI